MKLQQHQTGGAASASASALVAHLILQSRPFLLAGLIWSLLAVSQLYHSLQIASVGCGSNRHHGVASISSPLKIRSVPLESNDSSSTAATSPCQFEYDRISSNQTHGLTQTDLLRSRAFTGNQYRLHNAITTLTQRQRPFTAVVAGGSISLGHGTFSEFRYGERLADWMNDMYPLSSQQSELQNKHQVINVAAHGADMCSMAKRLNILYSDLQSQLMNSNNPEPDLILLEFAVNDYQGQDHLIMIDHKTSVFFDGFQELVLCAEVVIHSLLTTYPRAAIAFVEVQTAIVTRKSGALLHLGVAQQYGIPVISYAEAMFSEYYRLIRMLEGMDDVSYSFPKEMWMKDDGGGGIGIDERRNGVVNNASQYASAVLPYPHGCSPCQDQTIISQFRQGECIYTCIVVLNICEIVNDTALTLHVFIAQNKNNKPGGCKSICTFVERSSIIHNRKLKCNAKQNDIPPGRSECFVPYLAHDAIHPSAVGHAIIKDLIVDALATVQLRACLDGIVYERDVLPLTTFVASSFEDLKVRSDFLWVHDVDRIFSRWDELKPIAGKVSSGFKRYADDSLKQRPGWIATNEKGGESITFPIDLPPGECYTVYVAILRSYKGMGTMLIEVRDFGSKKGNSASSKVTATKKVDGLWTSPISVWSDVQITVRSLKLWFHLLLHFSSLAQHH